MTATDGGGPDGPSPVRPSGSGDGGALRPPSWWRRDGAAFVEILALSGFAVAGARDEPPPADPGRIEDDGAVDEWFPTLARRRLQLPVAYLDSDGLEDPPHLAPAVPTEGGAEVVVMVDEALLRTGPNEVTAHRLAG